jgi:hypothetical protein
MAEQKPDRGYRRNWLRYLVIYLVVGGVIYLLVWLIFLRGGGLYG